MNLKKIIFILLIVLFSEVLSYAQKAKPWAKALDTAVGRQVAAKTLPKTPAYHPVFGYMVSLPVVSFGKLKPIFSFEEKTEPGFYEARLVQVAPLMQPYQPAAFVRFELLLPAQLTQAFYLWRLGHVQDFPVSGGYYRFLQEQAQKVYHEHMSYNAHNSGLMQADQLPNLQFLKRLINPNITPSSYAELYAKTFVYPKHVTLSGYGFPVKTEGDAYAKMLDNYLMLSNPGAMSSFNNTIWWNTKDHGYTPFVLTKEEHEAADKLLALRQEGEKLPAHPTVRNLLELAYNRLETHSIPYSQVDEIGPDYKAYPNYKNTQLYRTIKEALKGQAPLETYHHPGYYFLENVDMTHLIVLDAVMGGVEIDNLEELRRALSAFDKLCADVHPDAKQAIAHLAVLQKNLRIVFSPLIRLGENTKKNRSPEENSQWRKEEIANYADFVLNQPIHNLIGRNWIQR